MHQHRSHTCSRLYIFSKNDFHATAAILYSTVTITRFMLRRWQQLYSIDNASKSTLDSNLNFWEPNWRRNLLCEVFGDVSTQSNSKKIYKLMTGWRILSHPACTAQPECSLYVPPFEEGSHTLQMLINLMHNLFNCVSCLSCLLCDIYCLWLDGLLLAQIAMNDG